VIRKYRSLNGVTLLGAELSGARSKLYLEVRIVAGMLHLLKTRFLMQSV
jgi:hypothetical protein